MAIRKSEWPDLIWLWQNDRPKLPEQLRDQRVDRRDKTIDVFLPETFWQLIAQHVTRARGLDLIKCIERSKILTGERGSYEAGLLIESLVDTKWVLDKLATRKLCGEMAATVSLSWIKERRFLIWVIDCAGHWLHQDEHEELALISCHLVTQICPRHEDHRSWGDLGEAISEAIESVRRIRD